MHYLSHYTGPLITEALTTAGAFFAFSSAQVEEQRDKSRDLKDYVSLGAGLVCPKEHSSALVAAIDAATAKGIAMDLAANGRLAVIRRELNNYECPYTGDPSDAIDALAAYGIQADEVLAVFVTMECE